MRRKSLCIPLTETARLRTIPHAPSSSKLYYPLKTERSNILPPFLSNFMMRLSTTKEKKQRRHVCCSGRQLYLKNETTASGCSSCSKQLIVCCGTFCCCFNNNNSRRKEKQQQFEPEPYQAFTLWRVLKQSHRTAIVRVPQLTEIVLLLRILFYSSSNF